MKIYLRLSATIFFLVSLQLGAYLYDPTFLEKATLVEECVWGWLGVCSVMFVFGMGLNWTLKRKANQLKKEKEQLADLIIILKEGREDQLAVIAALKANRLADSVPAASYEKPTPDQI